MILSKNLKSNLKTLLSISLNTYYDNIVIVKTDMMDDTFMCNFERKVSINHLKKINDYLGTDIRSKIINYSLIANKNNDIIKLNIENIQLTLLNNTDDLINKINDYNEKITNKLKKLSKYLYETLYPTDLEISDWTFYYISHNRKHIGFPNIDLQNSHSIKVYVDDFDTFKNKSFPTFYNLVAKYTGSLNDAKIRCMRRNYNSKHGSDWNVCKYGTPIEYLWTY